MDRPTPPWRLDQLTQLFGGELHGAPDLVVHRPVPAESDDPNGIAFCEGESYLERAKSSGVGALLLSEGLSIEGKPYITVKNPRMAFGQLLALVDRPLPIAAGIHETAVVDPSAQISPSASVGAYAVVERGAKIGDGAQVFAFAYIGEGCEVGEGSIIYPHATLYQDVKIGKRAIVHSGAVIGADGFGFYWDGEKRVKVPQVGNVVLGDDVEIGACTTIDRATAGSTFIADGTKLDNLVQVGHNVQIGAHGVIAGQTGISGSSSIGDRVIMGGQVAISDHARLGDDVTFGGRTATASDILEPGVYLGVPARPIGEALRSLVLGPKLPELFQRLRKLEKRLAELEKNEE